jgi:prevent-host-death family protein
MSPRVAVSTVPKALRRASRGERLIVQRRGKDVAALVSIEDLELLEEYEDRLDALLAREAIFEMKRAGAKPIPWSQVKREAGLR